MVHEVRDVIFMERGFDNRVVSRKTMQKAVSEVIPVSEEETSDKEISDEENGDLELDQNVPEIVQESQPQLRLI